MIKAYQAAFKKPVIRSDNMIWILIAVIGFLSMYQGGLNRLMATEWGIPSTVLMTALVFLGATAVFFALVQWDLLPRSPLFQNLGAFQKFKAWYLLPGLFGFAFVLGVPIAISRVGAVLTFVALVIAQVAAGASWDLIFENKPIEGQKWAGVAIACVGIWVATRKA